MESIFLEWGSDGGRGDQPTYLCIGILVDRSESLMETVKEISMERVCHLQITTVTIKKYVREKQRKKRQRTSGTR